MLAIASWFDHSRKHVATSIATMITHSTRTEDSRHYEGGARDVKQTDITNVSSYKAAYGIALVYLQ